MAELWKAIRTAAENGESKASFYLGPSLRYNTQSTDCLFFYLHQELAKIGRFDCLEAKGHTFQCDCDEMAGCGVFLKVSWNIDFL